MDAYGSEILVEKFSKLSLVNKKCLLHVYGYNHNVITSDQLNEPVTFDADDQFKITCKYKYLIISSYVVRTNKSF